MRRIGVVCLVAVIFVALPAFGQQASPVKPTMINVHDAQLIAKLDAKIKPPKFSRDGVLYTDKFLTLIGERTFLMQRGWDQKGNCRSWFVELTSDASGLAVAGRVRHECNGNPCNSCYMELQPVVSCGCNTEGGKCDHKLIYEPGTATPETTTPELEPSIKP